MIKNIYYEFVTEAQTNFPDFYEYFWDYNDQEEWRETLNFDIWSKMFEPMEEKEVTVYLGDLLEDGNICIHCQVKLSNLTRAEADKKVESMNLVPLVSTYVKELNKQFRNNRMTLLPDKDCLFQYGCFWIREQDEEDCNYVPLQIGKVGNLVRQRVIEE